MVGDQSDQSDFVDMDDKIRFQKTAMLARMDSSSYQEKIELLEKIHDKWVYTEGNTIFEYLQHILDNFELDSKDLRIGNLEESFQLCLFEINYLNLLLIGDQVSIQQKESDEIRSIREKVHKVLSSIMEAENAIRYSLLAKSQMETEFFEDIGNQHHSKFQCYSPLNLNDISHYQKLVIFIQEQLRKKRYRRYNSDCYEKIITVDGYDTHAWKKKTSLLNFIYQTVNKDTNPEMWLCLTHNCSNPVNAEKYILQSPSLEFPELEKSRYVFSFRNGIYFVKRTQDEKIWEEFIAYNDPSFRRVGEDIVACKYFNKDFHKRPYTDWFDIIKNHCKNFHNIMTYQQWSEDVQRWLCIMLGRNLYKLNELDKWQILGYLLGYAGSGKSTILTQVLKKFYESCDVGIISNNMEKKFGLGPLENKKIFIGPEIKGNLAMEQSEFQSMISGEDLQIARKYKDAESIVWNVPGMLAGNEIPGYNDNSGSIVRRLLIFKFNKKVVDGDPKLGDKLSHEIPDIIQACNKAYQEATRNFGDKDIWTAVPKYFLETKSALAESTNALVNFLSSDKIIYQADFKDEEIYIREKEFLKAFMEYCNEHNLKKPKWNEDYYQGPLNDRYITVIKKDKRKYPRNDNGRVYSGRFLTGIDVKIENDQLF